MCSFTVSVVGGGGDDITNEVSALGVDDRGFVSSDFDSATVTFSLAAGARGINSAVRHLQAFNPEPIPDLPYTTRPFGGRVTAAESGDGRSTRTEQLAYGASPPCGPNIVGHPTF